MISDNKRRDVAMKLREYASWDGMEDCLVDCADWGERVLNLLGCGDTEAECYNALADLIEPSCDRNTPQMVAEDMFGKMRHSTIEEVDAYDDMLKSKSVEIHPVDRDALLELAEDVRGYCIERQIAPWVAGRIYDRIREACGE